MNEHIRDPGPSREFLTAQDLMHRRWTVAEIDELLSRGKVYEDERFELIDGEVVPMPAKGIRHEVVKVALAKHWYRALPDGIELAPETTFRINDSNFLEPDFVFYRKVDGLAALKPATCLLAVEISDTTLSYDLGRKARLYASFGVRELWVVEAVSLITHVHRKPQPQGYTEHAKIEADCSLTTDFAPELAVCLGSLDLG